LARGAVWPMIVVVAFDLAQCGCLWVPRTLSFDLHVLVYEAAEPVSSEHADGRTGTWRVAACGRALIQ
jgi:hypothetical protein